MSDDSFIREVDEELRSDRMQAFWSRYGKIVIAIAALIILGTAGYRYYEYSTTAKAQATGDAFMAAVSLADEGKREEAIAAFDALEKEAGPAYRTMARLRAASETAALGDTKLAIEKFDAIWADGSAEQNLRSIARIRAGMLMVDEGSVSDVESRVQSLTGPDAPYRNSALEALGLAYFKAGDLKSAHEKFDEISKSARVTGAMRQRVRIMLDVIASKGGPNN